MSQFQEKSPALPVDNFRFLVLARDTIMLQHCIILSLHYLSSGCLQLRRLKTKKNLKRFAEIVVIVTYKRWPLSQEVPNIVI